jgi:hypothetical protein
MRYGLMTRDTQEYEVMEQEVVYLVTPSNG